MKTENNAECQRALSVKRINALRKPWPPTLLFGARQSTVHFHGNVSATAGAKLVLNICFLSWTALSPVHLPCCASPLRINPCCNATAINEVTPHLYYCERATQPVVSGQERVLFKFMSALGS